MHATGLDFGPWCQAHLQAVEVALSRWVSADANDGADHDAPAALIEAMRYACLLYTSDAADD